MPERRASTSAKRRNPAWPFRSCSARPTRPPQTRGTPQEPARHLADVVAVARRGGVAKQAPRAGRLLCATSHASRYRGDAPALAGIGTPRMPPHAARSTNSPVDVLLRRYTARLCRLRLQRTPHWRRAAQAPNSKTPRNKLRALQIAGPCSLFRFRSTRPWRHSRAVGSSTACELASLSRRNQRRTGMLHVNHPITSGPPSALLRSMQVNLMPRWLRSCQRGGRAKEPDHG